ncbi:MAG: Wzz/FepE/Etk N-terminal domain-containing protein [Burkholderiaceae bacterium]
MVERDAQHGVDAEGMGLFEFVSLLRQNLKLLILAPLLAGLVALGITYLIRPTFTATTLFLPPQQHSTAASALAQLGPLAGLIGATGSIRTPADQYIALLQSVTVSDRLIEQFGLMQEYDVKYRIDARKTLRDKVRMLVGKKDGLIKIEVDDHDPQRAAAMANQYVDELRRLTSTIAVTEAQQRRMFFEHQLRQTKDKLIAAQQALAASGFSQGAIKAEPKAAAEGYARLRAEVTAAEVRLQATRGTLADDTPEVRQQQAALAALRSQLGRLEQTSDAHGGPDYVSKYREFKYQETLFDLFARQYELARVDESREGALIQVVDTAMPPEMRSWPKRALTAVATTLAAGILLAMFVVVRQSWRVRQSQRGTPGTKTA